MPYSSNDDLPERVRSRYSSNCQSVWRHTFNSVLEDYGDESRAFASATGQANKCQEKKTMEPKFKIFAPMLKASMGSDGKKRLHGIASSTIKDRHGDTMALSALADMERSASNNMTIFLNHSYNVPEDVAGYVEHAAIHQHPTDLDIHDLALDIVVNEKNDRAVKAWEAIDGGTMLGLSIGAMIPDGGATRDRKSGTYAIDHVELLETSLVGVPANPRSWVEYAVKSLNGLAPLVGDVVERSDGEIGILVDPEAAPTDLSFTPIPVTVLAKTIETEPPPPTEPDSPTEEPDAPEPEIEPVTPEELEGAEIGDILHPDKADATVSIETPFANITVDTGNRGKGAPVEGEPSQEAQLSAPEPEDQDETDQADQPVGWDPAGPVRTRRGGHQDGAPDPGAIRRGVPPQLDRALEGDHPRADRRQGGARGAERRVRSP